MGQEINRTPQPLRAGAFRRLETELAAAWERCLKTARDIGGILVAIGTLPISTAARFGVI